MQKRGIEALGLVGAPTQNSGTGSTADFAPTAELLGTLVLKEPDLDVKRAAALALLRFGQNARPAIALLRDAALALTPKDAEKGNAASGDGERPSNPHAKASRKVLGCVPGLIVFTQKKLLYVQKIQRPQHSLLF